MTRTLRYLLLFVFTGLSGSTFAQEIAGRVLDDKKEPLPSAVVQVYQGGILKGGNATDYDGNYVIKPLDPGYYTLIVLYAGFDSIVTTDVIVTPGNRTTQNFTMSKHVKGLPEVIVRTYKKPLVNIDDPSSHVLDRTEIAAAPTNEVVDLVALTPGLYQQTRGGAVNIGGGRTTGTLYIIDGVQVQGTVGTNMSQGAIDQVEVISSGIPANYGDVSGGVVNITSRGVAQKLTGSVRLQHSIDGYNNNLGNFSIAGPIYKKKIPGDNTRKKPVLGFALSGDFYDDHDRYPNYYENYVAKGSVLSNLEQNPLKIIANTSSGAPIYNYASNYISMSDLQQTKIPPHNVTQEARLNGKLDYQVSDNMHIVAGGMVDYVKQDLYSRSLIMFAPSATPNEVSLTGRGFIRFTQKFGINGDTTNKHSIISNAYYSVQADYQKFKQDYQDPNFKHNLFDYAYIGKFTETKQNIYIPAAFGSKDSVTGRTGTILFGSATTGIGFQRSELNKYMANYTTELYNSLNGFQPTQLTQIQALNGLVNGDEPNSTYGLFNSPGTTESSYFFYNSNQYALSVDASFDLLLGKTKHAIEFGLYYQQRIISQYSASANQGGTKSIWSLMRGLVSSTDNGNLILDKQHPIFVVNGKKYSLTDVNNGVVIPGATDTIIYNYKNNGSGTGNGLGTTFDQNLRKKLGLSATEDINIDALSPNTFSLNMFSADELLNSGRPLVGYYGYTYTGGSQPSNVNFNDFWTQKDANGNYTRPIGAFSPNYIAGYLLDKFNYKDVHFNIGVRVDRYSANTKVLIDPYSEYAEKTVSEVPGAGNATNFGKHPSNIGGDYVVYVDDNTSSSPTIVGYRKGDSWYDPSGKFVQDPSVLKQFSGGRDPQPFLVNPNTKITDTNFNPNQSFTDYTPQVSVQPRVSFNFPISDVADFYAHYDIYSQRPYPTALGIATAYDYYYLNQNANVIISNANLKPEQTFDYEVGFQQKLSDHSALTINAFYKERKNMIAIVPYQYAWPTTYYTYGNRDFTTTKGTTVNYDLRATNHLQMTLAYTLQFAEGTGSDANSTNGGGGQINPNGLLQTFIEAGLPNLRYVTALNYDSRHTITANINYRFMDGEGPIVDGMHILQNSGVDLIPKARSGEPYTRYSDALGNTVIGGVNGSRLPWHYGVDMTVYKNFALNGSKKNANAPQGVKPKRPLFLKAMIQVNNLLNTRDVLGVYGYTGRPDDNGYLTSSYGKQFVPQQINPATYTALYQIAINNPGNFNFARTINFSLEFNF